MAYFFHRHVPEDVGDLERLRIAKLVEHFGKALVNGRVALFDEDGNLQSFLRIERRKYPGHGNSPSDSWLYCSVQEENCPHREQSNYSTRSKLEPPHGSGLALLYSFSRPFPSTAQILFPWPAPPRFVQSYAS